MQEVLGLDPTAIAARRKQELYLKEAQEYRASCDLSRAMGERSHKTGRLEVPSFTTQHAQMVFAIDISRGRQNRIVSISIGLNRA